MRPTPRPVLGRPEEYDRAKRILNAGRHPTFIGRDLVRRNARNGGLLFFLVGEQDAAVAIVNPRISSLLVLCVRPEFRSQGVGKWAMAFLRPNFIRALESSVPYFERLGYVGFGKWKNGKTLRTRIMVRDEIRSLSGRLRQLEAKTDEGPGRIGVAAEHLGATLKRKRSKVDLLGSGDARNGERWTRSDREADDIANDREARGSAPNGVRLGAVEDRGDEAALEPKSFHASNASKPGSRRRRVAR